MSLAQDAIRMEIEDRCRDIDRRRQDARARGETFACSLAESALLKDYDERRPTNNDAEA